MYQPKSDVDAVVLTEVPIGLQSVGAGLGKRGQPLDLGSMLKFYILHLN